MSSHKGRKIHEGKTIHSSKRRVTRCTILDLGHSKDVAKAALRVDDTLLSRMLSIPEIIPAGVIIDAVGAARTVGRDRWEDLKKLFSIQRTSDAQMKLLPPTNLWRRTASRALTSCQIAQGPSGERRGRRLSSQQTWTAHDQRVAARYQNTGKSFSLSLTANDAGAFGELHFVQPGSALPRLRGRENRQQTRRLNQQKKRPPKRSVPEALLLVFGDPRESHFRRSQSRVSRRSASFRRADFLCPN